MNDEEKLLMLKARRAYQKEWREKNPEKVKAAQERHWLKKAMQMLEEQGDSTIEQSE